MGFTTPFLVKLTIGLIALVIAVFAFDFLLKFVHIAIRLVLFVIIFIVVFYFISQNWYEGVESLVEYLLNLLK